MSLGALDATSAYGRATSIKPPSIADSEAADGASASGFGGMIDMITDAASAMRTAESASAQQVAGKGDLIDVVTAIGAAEMALDTVVAVRDRVISAYSDIMRMQI